MSEEFQGTSRYRVVRRLGAGSMGVVYQVHDAMMGRDLALKTFNDFDPNLIYRMKREFRALCDVVHPNLVRFFELAAEGERWYFTMELVFGRDFLENLWEQRPAGTVNEARTIAADRSTFDVRDTRPLTALRNVSLSSAAEAPTEYKDTLVLPSAPRLSATDLDVVRDTLVQLVHGVHALHEQGKLHRDLKPSNVLVTEAGRVVLLDFGLVAELHHEWMIQSTMQGHVCGTVAYMSPEQSAGDELSPASDWYSVGVMLYEALSGRLPFEGKMFKILLDKQSEDAPMLRALLPDGPEDLCALTQQLLSRSPEERPGHEEILRRLGALPRRKPRSVSSRSLGFVGRGQELAQLRSAFVQVTGAAGHPILMRVCGEEGIGKSALIRAFSQSLQGEAIVLAGRCHEREQVPYKAFDSLIDMLSRMLRKLPEEERAPLMFDQLLHLARIFPVLERVEELHEISRDALEAVPALEVRGAAFRALRALFGRLAARTPVVLVLEDLQWGDADSARLLQALLSPPQAPRILVVASYRPQPAERSQKSPFFEVLDSASLFGMGQIDQRVHELTPLDPRSAEVLVRANLGVRAPVERIARASGGNPKRLLELAAQEFAERTQDSSQGIAGRLSQLSQQSKSLLSLLAVAARPLEVSVMDRAMEGAPRLLLELRSEGMVQSELGVEPERIEIVHGQVYAKLHADLSDAQRAQHHRALARALREEGPAQAEHVIAHLRAAGDHQEAFTTAQGAARRAFEGLAFERAAGFYRLSITIREQMSSSARSLWALQVQLAEALSAAGRGMEAAEEYLKAAKRAPHGHTLQIQAFESALRAGLVDRAMEILKLVVERVGLDVPSSAEAAARGRVVLRARMVFQGVRPKLRAKIEPDVRAQLEVLWSVVLGLVLIEPIYCGYFSARLMHLAMSAGDPLSVIRALSGEIIMAQSVERNLDRAKRLRAERDRILEPGMAEIPSVDSALAYPTVALTDGFCLYLDGYWAQAEQNFAQGGQLPQSAATRARWHMEVAQLLRLEALAQRGQFARLSGMLFATLAEAEAQDNRFLIVSLRSHPRISLLWVALDRIEPARVALDLVTSQWCQGGFHYVSLMSLLSRVQFELYQGQAEAAFQHLEASWEQVQRSWLMKVRVTQAAALELRARCALAVLIRTPRDQRASSMVKVVASSADRLQSLALSGAAAQSAVLRAQLRLLQGDREGGIRMLGAAGQVLGQAAMELLQAAVMFRRGQLMGSARGKGLMDDAARWMHQQGVRHPDRMTALLVPVM